MQLETWIMIQITCDDAAQAACGRLYSKASPPPPHYPPQADPQPEICMQQKRTCSSGVLVRCFYSGLVGGLPFVARVALLDCVGGLAFVV